MVNKIILSTLLKVKRWAAVRKTGPTLINFKQHWFNHCVDVYTYRGKFIVQLPELALATEKL